MPAKRIIILKRQSPDVWQYRYVLWADVPSANQPAYRNPLALSAYENCTAVELQAIRSFSRALQEAQGTVGWCVCSPANDLGTPLT